MSGTKPSESAAKPQHRSAAFFTSDVESTVSEVVAASEQYLNPVVFLDSVIAKLQSERFDAMQKQFHKASPPSNLPR